MIVPSFFGEYASQPALQAYVDGTALVLEGQTIWRNYLDLDIPQASLTFEQIIGRDRMEAAASIVDINAEAPVRSRNGLETYLGKIPSMKEAYYLDQLQMRELWALEESQLLNANGAVTALVKKLYDDVAKVSVAGDKRVDIMLLQALSTLSIDLSTTLNPDGAATGVVDLLPKAYQKQGVNIPWFTVDGNGNYTVPVTSATPIDDIENYIDYIAQQFGRGFGSILMSKPMWLKFKRLKQVNDRLQSYFNIGKANASFTVTLEAINEFFDSNMWPPIQVVNKISNIEKDGIVIPFRAMSDNNLSFIPAGKLGMLKNAFAYEVKKPIFGKQYAQFGATLVSQWAEDKPIREWTEMEMNAIPAIDIDAIFLLQTNVQQDAFTGGIVVSA